MFLIDLDQGRIIDDLELKETLSRQSPIRMWRASNIKIDDLEVPGQVVTPEYSASAA